MPKYRSLLIKCNINKNTVVILKKNIIVENLLFINNT